RGGAPRGGEGKPDVEARADRPGRVDMQFTAHETESFADADQAEADMFDRTRVKAGARVGDSGAEHAAVREELHVRLVGAAVFGHIAKRLLDYAVDADRDVHRNTGRNVAVGERHVDVLLGGD